MVLTAAALIISVQMLVAKQRKAYERNMVGTMYRIVLQLLIQCVSPPKACAFCLSTLPCRVCSAGLQRRFAVLACSAVLQRRPAVPYCGASVG